MSERKQNWNERFLKSFGPRFRIDVANPIMGFGGSDVVRMYGNTRKGDKFSFGMNESGTVELNADQRIDIIAGAKNDSRSTDIVIHSRSGTIDINVAQNGKVKIRGNNIELDAAESITFNARSIRMEGADEISLQAPKVWSRGKKGNLVPKTWGQVATFGTFIGADKFDSFILSERDFIDRVNLNDLEGILADQGLAVAPGSVIDQGEVEVPADFVDQGEIVPFAIGGRVNAMGGLE